MRTRGEHRKGRAAIVAVLALFTALSLPPVAGAQKTRVFLVGPKISPDWIISRQSFHDKLLALSDRRLRTAGRPSIQRGADDVSSHLSGRDLILLPEDVGLPAAVIGSRGTVARQQTSATLAIASLLAPYQPVSTYYEQKYPSLAQRGLPTRALGLALTDTFGRAAMESFAEIAERNHAWLEAGVDMARSWRVVCLNKATFRPPPGVEKCDLQDPAKVAALRDPDEPTRDYAYEATSPLVSNMALLFDPQGHLRRKIVKAYLTPAELPGQLDLAPGDVDGVTAVRTPVGTLGFVTSKDAFMPDVVDKLDARGVNLLVQPEFFVGDTLKTTGMWTPDTLKASGYSDVLREPSIDAMALPELTGNFFDFSADAQQHVVVKPRGKRIPHGFLAGQPSVPGFLRVAAYVVADPARRGEPFAERRRRLGLAGEALLPGGPKCPSPDVAGPCENGMSEGVVWTDVTVGATRRYHRRVRARGRTVFTHARRIAPSRRAQRNVDVASRGRLVAATFEERGRVVVILSGNGGRTWGPRSYPAGREAPHQWFPQVALDGARRLWVTWQDDRGGHPGVRVTSGPVLTAVSYPSCAAGHRCPRPRRRETVNLRRSFAVGGNAPQWRPTIAATGRGRAYAAWIDERERSADDDLPQAHLYGASLTPRGAAPARRLDQGTPATLAAKLDHSWAPDLTARGRRLLLSWVDFRTYDWRPYLRESRDAGATWTPERSVTDDPIAAESLDDTARGALTSSGPLVTWTDFRKRESSARRPHPGYDVYATRPGGPNHDVERGPRQTQSFSPSILASGRGALVAWQDMRAGVGHILLAPIDRNGRPGRIRRVDDGGRATWNAWRPAITSAGRGRVLVAWEDERHGPAQILFATAPLKRLR